MPNQKQAERTPVPLISRLLTFSDTLKTDEREVDDGKNKISLNDGLVPTCFQGTN